MNTVPCEMIRDLFPSYIDGLTSEKTNEQIRGHLEGCEACRAVLASMQDPEGSVPEQAMEIRKDIDYLKKNRKRNRRILFGSLAAALFLAAAVLAVHTFLIGTATDQNWIPRGLSVEDNRLTVEAVPVSSASAIAAFIYTEENGIVRIKARSVLVSPLHPGSKFGSYTAREKIREVWVGDWLFWSEVEKAQADDAHTPNEVWFRFINQTDTDILSIGYGCYKNGVLCSSGGGENADGSAHTPGESFWIGTDAMNFGGSWDSDAVLELAVFFETADGRKIELPERILVAAAPGSFREFRLTGSRKSGYRIEQ